MKTGCVKNFVEWSLVLFSNVAEVITKLKKDSKIFGHMRAEVQDENTALSIY